MILDSTSTVIHSVKQRLLRNRPGSALRPLVTSCAKDYKAHSLKQTSFAESPTRDAKRVKARQQEQASKQDSEQQTSLSSNNDGLEASNTGLFVSVTPSV